VLLAACSGDSAQGRREKIQAACDDRHGEGFIGNDDATVCPAVAYCAMEHPTGAYGAVFENPRPSDHEQRALDAYTTCLNTEGPQQEVPDDLAST
jgi:hypothetical protein